MADMSGLITGANLVGGLIKQGADIRDGIDTMFDDHAHRQAGERLAAGDLRGAAAVLGSRGLIKETAALTDQANTADALTSISQGDFAAAKGSAAKTGDTALYGQVQTQQQQELKHRAEFLGNAADALMQIKDRAQRKEAFTAHIAPTLKAMGMDDDQLAQVASSDFSDQTIQSFKASVGDLDKMQIQQHPETGEILGIDQKTGAVKVLRQGTPKPISLAKDARLVDPITGKTIATGGGGNGGTYKTLKNADGSDSIVWLPDTPGGEAPGAASASDQASGAAVSGKIAEQIATSAAKRGGTPSDIAYAKRLAKVESDGDPNAQNGSSGGLFQFHPDTFAANGGHNIASVDDQVGAVLSLSHHDRATLKGLGVPATDANTYIMHQQGPGGGPALLTADPNKSAIDVLTPVYQTKERTPEQARAMARKAIVGNGGEPSMTAGQFVDYWHKRWAGVKQGADGGEKLPPGAKVVAKGEGADLEMDDKSIDYVAQQYMATGQLPPLGVGKAAAVIKQKIIQRAADIESETGRTGADAVARHAETKAATATLSKITTMRGLITASERTVDKNMEVVNSLAGKGAGKTGSPIVNQPLQWVRKNVFGSADVASFDAALGTVADEYAKVMTSSTGSGGSATSDSARKEAYERMSRAASISQLQGVMRTMRAEMENRVNSLKDEEDQAKSTLNGRPAPARRETVQPGGSGGPKVRTYNPKTGKLEN